MQKIYRVCLGLFFSVSAFADITFLVPQKPGEGTSVWAQIVATEMEKYLDEKITIRHVPGARDIPGFNLFHNELQQDDTVVMVSHGGNAVAFLEEEVDYNYNQYDSVGMMNLNIIAGRLKGDDLSTVKFAAGSGMTPEGMAMTLLICGPNKTTDEYIACFKENVVWVKGMSGGERRLAFKRKELNATRENPAAYKKHVQSNPDAELWFHHGILQADGSHADDPNYEGYQFEILFEQKWGVKPSGELYDAYNLAKSFRDALQKALWVRKGNPNLQRLRDALTQVATNPQSVEAIEKSVGRYEWVIGDDGNAMRDTLMTFINRPALETLVKFNRDALGLSTVLKENLL
jgi:hypothetical protein